MKPDKRVICQRVSNKRMRSLFPKSRAREQASVMVIMTVGLVLFLLLAGTVIDYGLKYHVRQQLQKWVDASALAGALSLPDAPTAQQEAATFYPLNVSPNQSASVSKRHQRRGCGLLSNQWRQRFGHNSL